MRLSKIKFDELLQTKELVISLIGMSNIGKTHWSDLLTDLDFDHIDCDALIEEGMSSILHEGGYSGIEGVSAWMGQPYEDRYDINQKRYLTEEISVMSSILKDLFDRVDNNTVIDTTGSVVHTGEEVGNMLKDVSLVVYIRANEEQTDILFDQYFRDPKPTVFGNFYRQWPNQPVKHAMADSYRSLLEYRSQRYDALADVIIDQPDLMRMQDPAVFLKMIRGRL